MIKSRRLFLLPFLSMFLIWFFPIGTLCTIAICCFWYAKNQDRIHNYFKGIIYSKEEYDPELQKALT